MQCVVSGDTTVQIMNGHTSFSGCGKLSGMGYCRFADKKQGGSKANQRPLAEITKVIQDEKKKVRDLLLSKGDAKHPFDDSREQHLYCLSPR
jgi:hypothetical protein